MKQPLIVIVDYGVGNVFSVEKAIQRLGYSNIMISRKSEEINNADTLILPGVGAFKGCIDNLIKFNLINILNENVINKGKPILGICIGMQLMADFSEENGLYGGLGWIPGRVVKINVSKNIPIPHVGWNNLSILKKLFKLLIS